MKASDRVKEIEGRLEALRVKEQEAIVQTAEQELLSLHPDFVTLREDQQFLNWLDEQPQSISDGIYKNILVRHLLQEQVDGTIEARTS